MQGLVTEIVARTIDHVAETQKEAEAAVRALSPKEQERLCDAYGADFAWRGVVSDNFWLLWRALAKAGEAVEPKPAPPVQTVVGEDGEDIL